MTTPKSSAYQAEHAKRAADQARTQAQQQRRKAADRAEQLTKGRKR